MGWLPWVLIAPMRSLAEGIIKPWRQLEPYLNGFGLQARKMGSPDGYNRSELAVALHDACAEEHLVKEAVTEGLTGLKTHRYFREALEGEWRRSARSSRPFSVIMMDLDGFKQVNAQGGHLEGDRVLAAVATLLDARSRQPNVVARYGEDEFAILAPETNAQQAEILAERLRASIEADDFLRAQEVTASIGIATFPDYGRTPEEILRVADSGMYLAKQCNGNCVKVGSLNSNAHK
jgi:diguanylate cyclase (GGDEF)-like protein